MDREASAARSGRHELWEARHDHTESSPELTGGDVDADWEDAYAVGDEAPGGDNPTPDQDGWTTSARLWASSTRTTRN